MNAIYTVKCIKGLSITPEVPALRSASAGMTENGRDGSRFDLGSINYFLHRPHVAFLFQSPKFDLLDQISRRRFKKKSPPFHPVISYTCSDHTDDGVHVSFIVTRRLAL